MGFRFSTKNLQIDPEAGYRLRIQMPFDADGDVWVKKHSPKLDPTAFAAEQDFGGKFYRFFLDPDIDAIEAQKRCEKMGGNLACPSTETENQFIHQFVGKMPVWLGGSDQETEGEWKWKTGEPFNFTQWAEKNPSKKFSENYMAMFVGGNWGDTGRTFGNVCGFVCEWGEREAIQRQKADIEKLGRSVVLMVRDGTSTSTPICKVGGISRKGADFDGGRIHFFNFRLNPKTPVVVSSTKPANNRITYVLYEAQSKLILAYSKSGVLVSPHPPGRDAGRAIVAKEAIPRLRAATDQLKDQFQLPIPDDFAPIWYQYRDAETAHFKVWPR